MMENGNFQNSDKQEEIRKCAKCIHEMKSDRYMCPNCGHLTSAWYLDFLGAIGIFIIGVMLTLANIDLGLLYPNNSSVLLFSNCQNGKNSS